MKNLKIIVLFVFITNFIYAQETITVQGEGAGEAAGGNTSAFGYLAGQNASGVSNTFIGALAGKDAGAGRFNTVVGFDAFKNNGDGQNNLILGHKAGMNNSGGGDNVFAGAYAGQNNNNGYDNIYLGATSGANNNGSRNILIGRAAGNQLTGGDSNVFIGYQAGATLADNISGKLCIENSNDTDSPLIYGDFSEGQVGINTSYVPAGYNLAVEGNIIAEEIQVMERIHWPDYVFEEAYDLMTLPELETEIETLGHLPGVPSAEEVEENGHALGKMDAILLEKVEELTLHLIEMNKQMEAQQAEIDKLKTENDDLKTEVSTLKK